MPLQVDALKKYFHRLPSFLFSLFPKVIWRGNGGSNQVYITFDDGPVMNVTNEVLRILKQYNAKATFFCLGEHMKLCQETDLTRATLKGGHSIAAHGFHHLDGWKTSVRSYVDNVGRGIDLYDHDLDHREVYFRPPYGKLSWRQYSNLKRKLKIVMWTIMAGDFDSNLSKEKCLSRLKKNTKSGDIIVFHDNEKSWKTLSYVLPRFLDFCIQSGFEFGLIKDIE